MKVLLSVCLVVCGATATFAGVFLLWPSVPQTLPVVWLVVLAVFAAGVFGTAAGAALGALDALINKERVNAFENVLLCFLIGMIWLVLDHRIVGAVACLVAAAVACRKVQVLLVPPSDHSC